MLSASSGSVTGERSSAIAGSGLARQRVPVSAPASVPRKAPLTLLSEVRVHKDYLPKSARGRKGQSSMRARTQCARVAMASMALHGLDSISFEDSDRACT